MTGGTDPAVPTRPGARRGRLHAEWVDALDRRDAATGGRLVAGHNTESR